jgi:hypothetical protein
LNLNKHYCPPAQHKYTLQTRRTESSKPYKTDLCLWHRKEEQESFAVGHIALAYLLGKGAAKLLKTEINLPLILTLSVIPDTDILFHPLIEHRGPMHSIVVAFVVFLPFFVVYRKTAIPYCIAVVQHSLVGDYLAGGRIQLFWPVTTQYFGTDIGMRSLTNITNEWVFFLIALVVMVKSHDIYRFLKSSRTNLILAIPTFTVLLPTVLGYPVEVPLLLMPPHLFFLLLFLLAIAAALFRNEIHVKNFL